MLKLITETINPIISDIRLHYHERMIKKYCNNRKQVISTYNLEPYEYPEMNIIHL